MAFPLLILLFTNIILNALKIKLANNLALFERIEKDNFEIFEIVIYFTLHVIAKH